MTEGDNRKRFDPSEALASLPEHQRALISQNCLDESQYSPAFYALEVDSQDNGQQRPIDALHIKVFGRFGNLLIQIGHALDVAHYLGVDTIFFDASKQAPGVFEDSQPIEIGGKTLIAINHASPSTEKTLVGTFWSLHLLVPPQHINTCRRDVVPSQQIFPIIGADIRNNVLRLKSADVVVHFRGGDIFENAGLNADYAQPPFAFYKKALADCLIEGSKVYVVYEDKLNPAIDATISWLESEQQDYEAHSGELKDDLKVMFGAKTIISSYGTFVSAVMKLSPNIERVYYFDNRWVVGDQHRFRPDVRLREYRDVKGGYTKHGEWMASAEQIACIVDYDSDAIVAV